MERKIHAPFLLSQMKQGGYQHDNLSTGTIAKAPIQRATWLHVHTWEASDDRSYVTHGDYSPNYTYVKEAFAVRAGLIDKDHVFSEDEAADLYRCVNHTRDDCENLTYEQEQKLKSL